MSGRALAAAVVFALAPIACFAQAATPLPAPVSCANPNVDPRVVSAAVPVTPLSAQQQGVTGEVDIRLQLDEQSKIVSASILSSPSPLLNTAALSAVRNSTFQTRIVNCRPIAADYKFIVFFTGKPATPPSISDYFLGTWYCASEIKSRVVKAYGLSGGGAALVLDNAYVTTDDAIGLGQETYTQGPTGLNVRSRFDGYTFAGTSSGWNANALVFTGPFTKAPASGDAAVITTQRETYTRIDDDHFTRMHEWIPPGQTAYTTTSRETCARIARPAP